MQMKTMSQVLPDAQTDLSCSDSVNVLALSAGGEYGAYGAGFLVGWNKVGSAAKPISRQCIHVVTGVSTGSIMATHAFLGNRDQELEDIYTNIDDDMIYKKRWFIEWLWANSLFDTTKKRQLLEEHITSEMINEVGQSAPERRLYIGIVNIDTGEFERVDMVALANDITKKIIPDGCFRSVIDASSAIEVAFEPIFIDNAMFGDGGARHHLFLVSPDASSKNDVATIKYRAISLVHGDLQIEPQKTKNGVLQIADRTSSIFVDQLLKDSVRLSHALMTHPEAVVGDEIAKTLPQFAPPLYAAASTAARKCKHDTKSQCSSDTTSGGADVFCKPYMQCLAIAGEQDGKTYASTGNWLPFEQLNLGSGKVSNSQENTAREATNFK
jgi:hypothetical protein